RADRFSTPPARLQPLRMGQLQPRRAAVRSRRRAIAPSDRAGAGLRYRRDRMEGAVDIVNVITRIGKKLFFGRFQTTWRWPDQIPKGEWERITFSRANGDRLAGVFGAARGELVHGGV